MARNTGTRSRSAGEARARLRPSERWRLLLLLADIDGGWMERFRPGPPRGRHWSGEIRRDLALVVAEVGVALGALTMLTVVAVLVALRP